MNYLIQKGYYKWGQGWVESENGGIYAVIPVDSDLKQTADGDVALYLDEISNAIKRIIARKGVL